MRGCSLMTSRRVELCCTYLALTLQTYSSLSFFKHVDSQTFPLMKSDNKLLECSRLCAFDYVSSMMVIFSPLFRDVHFIISCGGGAYIQNLGLSLKHACFCILNFFSFPNEIIYYNFIACFKKITNI